MTPAQRTAFLADRRKGLGASDVAAIFGMSKWATALSVWADKLGLSVDQPPTGPQEWGLRLEPAIGQAFTDKTGFELAKPLAPYADPRCPVIRSNLDFATGDEQTFRDGDACPVDAKTSRTAKGWGPDGSDEVPDEILFQLQTQMACTGAVGGYVAALIGGNDFRVYTIARSDPIVRAIRERAAAFWADYVVPEIPPPPDWKHPLTPELVCRLAAIDPGRVLNLPDPSHEFCRVAEDFNLLRAAEAAIKARKETAKARLVDLAGGATVVQFAYGKFTHKEQHRKEHVVKASTSKPVNVRWSGVEPDVSLVLDRLPRGYESSPDPEGDE